MTTVLSNQRVSDDRTDLPREGFQLLLDGSRTNARIQRVLSDSVQIFQVIFLVDEEIEDPNTTISGSSWPTIKF